MNMVKGKLHRPPICSPTEIDNSKEAHLANLELNNGKIKTTLTKFGYSSQSKMNDVQLSSG